MYHDIVDRLITCFSGRLCHFNWSWSYQRQIDDCGVVPVAISQAARHFAVIGAAEKESSMLWNYNLKRLNSVYHCVTINLIKKITEV